MATRGPPKRKKKTNPESNVSDGSENLGNIIAQLKSVDDEPCGPPLSLPANVTPEQLQLLVNQLLNNVRDLTI